MSQITNPQFIKENYDTKLMSLKAETYRMSSPSKDCVCVCVCVCVYLGVGIFSHKEHHVWGAKDSGETPSPQHTYLCVTETKSS